MLAQESITLRQLEMVVAIATSIVLCVVIVGFIIFMRISRRERSVKRPREIEVAKAQSKPEKTD